MRQDDTYAKYIRLSGTIFFSFIGFIIAFVLLLLSFRLFFGLLSYIPWLVYMYMLFIICVPASLFLSVYFIFLRRTPRHPSRIVRFLSYGIFSIAILIWMYVFVTDIILFFTFHHQDIAPYSSYNLLFLASNVGLIFLMGIIQALTLPAEPDWMEKRKKKDLT